MNKNIKKIFGFSCIMLPPFMYYIKKNMIQSNNINEKENLIIVGNGFGSLYLQKYLDNNKFDKKIIAENDKVLYTPKLVKSIYKEESEKINPNNKIIKDIIEEIKFNDKIINGNENKYNYDKVIFCIGSETNDFGINGVKEYAFKFKTEEDKNKLKEKLADENIKKISIIGSGAVGIELSSLLKSKGYEVTIIEGMKEILPGFNNKTKEEIEKYLCENNIRLIKENFVKSINEKTIITDKQTIEYDLVIWSGGIKFNGYETTNLYKNLNEKANITLRGIHVKDNFSIDNNNSVFCIGDMVANMGPPTAQNTKNQAKWLSQYLNNDKKDIEYEIKDKGKVLHLNDKMYLESEYYNGYIIKPMNYFIDFFIKNV